MSATDATMSAQDETTSVKHATMCAKDVSMSTKDARMGTQGATMCAILTPTAIRPRFRAAQPRVRKGRVGEGERKRRFVHGVFIFAGV